MINRGNIRDESLARRLVKLAVMACAVAAAGWGSRALGVAGGWQAQVAVCTFAGVICTTLFFWTHRVAAAFLGVAALVATQTVTLEGMLRSTELDIIFFLIGMMIIVGVLKDLGFWTWVIQSVVNTRAMTGLSFTVILCVLSAVLSGIMDEVSSIVVVLALVFQVCDTLKVKPAPFVLIAVLCTNIGSAATMLGNPVGIFVGNKAGFAFTQFLAVAAPVAAVALAAAVGVILFWFRAPIREMTARMARHREGHQGLGPPLRIPYRRGLLVLAVTVGLIAFHSRIEAALGLTGEANRNAFLIVTPLIIAAVLMICRPRRARDYVQNDVEWWTLLFFILLFAIAGALEEQGVTRNAAALLGEWVSGGPPALVPFVLGLSAVGSAFVDNIVFAAAFTPVVQSLAERSADFSVLWWALLFGACFGGNVTVVGSTANMIALGLLEKRARVQIAFHEWLKIGALVGLITTLIAWAMLCVLPAQAPAAQRGAGPGGGGGPAPAQALPQESAKK
ncbi:MAG: SLC13 family permease [Kiritimatiellaeota bacterium]|nr:SLC13 family permease [Kiritimatiellota bacterium]